MSRRIVLSFAILLMTTVFAGCYRTRLHFGPTPAPIRASKTDIYYVIGIVPLSGPIGIDGICPDGVALIYQWEGLFSAAAKYLSGGVIAAREVEVFCRSGAQANAMMDEDGMLYDVEMISLASPQS